MLGRVLVFLVRHAHAGPGDPDALRSLSDRGRAEAEALAERLATHETPPRRILTSPLMRARQTADEIGSTNGIEATVDDRLAPGATLDGLRAVVAGDLGPVAVVGHQPDCSEIAVALTGHDPGFSTGSFAELTLP